MLSFSLFSPAIPVHIHSVEPTMEKWHQTAEQHVCLSKQYLTNMEPFL